LLPLTATGYNTPLIRSTRGFFKNFGASRQMGCSRVIISETLLLARSHYHHYRYAASGGCLRRPSSKDSEGTLTNTWRGALPPACSETNTCGVRSFPLRVSLATNQICDPRIPPQSRRATGLVDVNILYYSLLRLESRKAERVGGSVLCTNGA
jgi:hypothetical protein